MLTFDEIRNNEEIRTYIRKGNENLGVLGYTEHAFAHAKRASQTAAEILTKLIIGKFAFEPQANGNLSLIYNG